VSEIADFLNAQYDRREKAAKLMAKYYPPPWEVFDRGWMARVYGEAPFWEVIRLEQGAWMDDDTPGLDEIIEHVALHDPDWVLADIEAKRQIIREVMSWRHDVVEGDCWFTCGAATEERDGGECCDDNQRDECTCGLDERREKILRLSAAPFSGEPGYDAERWAV
jgi:hypothetical protein